MEFSDLSAAKAALLLAHREYMDSDGGKGSRLSFSGEDLSGVDFNGAYIDSITKEIINRKTLQRASSEAMKAVFGGKIPDYTKPVDKENSR